MKKQKPTLTPTPEILEAAKTVFKAELLTGTIRPIVEEYKKRILEKYQFKIDDQFRDKGKTITELKESCLMSDEDFIIYDRECRKARDQAKLTVEKDEFCPLFIAEEMQRQAERTLMDLLCEQINPRLEHKITTAKLIAHNIVKYKEILEGFKKAFFPMIEKEMSYFVESLKG